MAKEMTAAEIKGRCRDYLKACEDVMYKQEKPEMMRYAAERLVNAVDLARYLGLITEEIRKAFDSEAAEIVEKSWKMKGAPGSGNSGGAQENIYSPIIG